MCAEGGQEQGESSAESVPDQPEQAGGEVDREPTWRTNEPPASDSRPVRFPERYDRTGRAIDNLGRIVPSRLNWLNIFRAVPSLAGRFGREVPPEFLSDDVQDGVPGAVVACPCGGEPFVAITKVVECECERFYLNLGKCVKVANSPQDRDEAEPPTGVVN